MVIIASETMFLSPLFHVFNFHIISKKSSFSLFFFFFLINNTKYKIPKTNYENYWALLGRIDNSKKFGGQKSSLIIILVTILLSCCFMGIFRFCINTLNPHRLFQYRARDTHMALFFYQLFLALKKRNIMKEKNK